MGIQKPESEGEFDFLNMFEGRPNQPSANPLP